MGAGKAGNGEEIPAYEGGLIEDSEGKYGTKRPSSTYTPAALQRSGWGFKVLVPRVQ